MVLLSPNQLGSGLFLGTGQAAPPQHQDAPYMSSQHGPFPGAVGRKGRNGQASRHQILQHFQKEPLAPRGGSLPSDVREAICPGAGLNVPLSFTQEITPSTIPPSCSEGREAKS